MKGKWLKLVALTAAVSCAGLPSAVFAQASGGSGSSGGSYSGPGLSTLMSETCEDCMYPIMIAGETDGDENGIPADSFREEICWCKQIYEIKIPGVPYGGWVPERMIETVHGAYDSPIYGRNLKGSSDHSVKNSSLEGGSANTSNGGDNQIGFSNMHIFEYPENEVYGDMMSAACLSDNSGGSTMSYLSEIDSSWSDDSVSLILSPEAAVFATQAAQLACVADAASADVYQPIDPMFWCMGSWGSAYPQNGVTGPMDVPRQAAYTAAKAIAMQERRGSIFMTMGDPAICNSFPEPVLTKSMFKLEQLWPVAETTGDHWIGQDPNIWGEFRYRTYTGEDFVQLNWQFVNCCVY